VLIKFILMFPDALAPTRASSGAVGFDVYAYHVVDKETRATVQELPFELRGGESVLIGIGIVFAVPPSIDCQVRPRSGLASKYDVELSNSPGTVDPDYRGEIGILLRNRGKKGFTITKGMRVAQLVFTQVHLPVFHCVDELPPTYRNTGGFGSTGLTSIALGEVEYLAEQRRWDEHFMRIAISASLLSNCLRGVQRNADGFFEKDDLGRYIGASRHFGCVIVKDRTAIATGFNYRLSECDEKGGCAREVGGTQSGIANDIGCLHAEIAAIQNHALVGGPSLRGATVYINAEPCRMCAKVLLGCGIGAVVVPDGVYPTNGLPLILDAGIEVRYISVV